jgi:hypothetical protein
MIAVERTETMAATRKAAAPEAGGEFFDWNGLPVYRDAKGLTVVAHGGKEHPVEDLWKFLHEAVPVDESDFEALKVS